MGKWRCTFLGKLFKRVRFGRDVKQLWVLGQINTPSPPPNPEVVYPPVMGLRRGGCGGGGSIGGGVSPDCVQHTNFSHSLF